MTNVNGDVNVNVNMQQQIKKELHRIEREEQVRILYACESGSRAWGFPSKDSDYDVRFLYIRPLEWYVSIFDKRDVIERPISNMLDINGWDLKKALNLFRKSNPPLLEWLQSPIRYMETGSAAEQIRLLSSSTFSPKACLYHYLHMAKGNYREYLRGERVNVKKYFYVLRPILACAWIEKHNTMPPMEFRLLVDDFIPEGSGLKVVILDMLARKIAGEERNDEPRIDVLNAFLEEQMTYFEQAASHQQADGENQDEALDGLFRSILAEGWKTINCLQSPK